MRLPAEDWALSVVSPFAQRTRNKSTKRNTHTCPRKCARITHHTHRNMKNQNRTPIKLFFVAPYSAAPVCLVSCRCTMQLLWSMTKDMMCARSFPVYAFERSKMSSFRRHGATSTRPFFSGPRNRFRTNQVSHTCSVLLHWERDYFATQPIDRLAGHVGERAPVLRATYGALSSSWYDSKLSLTPSRTLYRILHPLSPLTRVFCDAAAVVSISLLSRPVTGLAPPPPLPLPLSHKPVRCVAAGRDARAKLGRGVCLPGRASSYRSVLRCGMSVPVRRDTHPGTVRYFCHRTRMHDGK